MLKAFGIDTSKAKWRRKATDESPSSAAEGNGSDDTYESPSVDDDSAAASSNPPPNCKTPKTVNPAKALLANAIPVVS